MITKDQLAALASIEAPPAVSIYLPMHEKGREVRQNAIRLRKALGAVTERLTAEGMRRPEVTSLLQPAQDLVDDPMFWAYQSQGLAVFLAKGLFQHHKLPIEVPERQVVAPRPHVKPLLRLLAADGRFYCLAVSAGAARLFVGSRFGFAQVEAGLPTSVAEISEETDYQNMRHAAPPARPRSAGPVGMPGTHNFGEDPEEQRKAQLIEYLRRIHNALEQFMAGKPAPVVLIAMREIDGHLRALPGGVSFVEERVHVDPGSLRDDELHQRAYAAVEPLFTQARAAAIDHFRALAGAGEERGATDLEAIVSAAAYGRVDTLFAVQGEQVWGRYDRDADRVAVEPEQTVENWDLLDHAAVQTLAQGGRVYLLPREEMPHDGPLAAILRY